jgi:hypothetical protein
MRNLTWLVLLAACAEPSPMPEPEPEPDEPEPQPGPTVACATVVQHDDEALGGILVNGLQALGRPASTTPMLRGGYTIHTTVPVGAVDPIGDAIAMLAALPGGPFVASELEVPNPPDLSTSLNRVTVRVHRTNIGGTPTPFGEEAFHFSLARDGAGGWNVGGMDVHSTIMHATATEIAALVACAQTPPHEAAIRAHEFVGTTLGAWCRSAGSYSYTAQPTDAVTFTGPTVWRSLDERGWPDGRHVGWHVVTPVDIVIDPGNYGLVPDNADCFCGPDTAGYSVHVTSTSGVVMVHPGLGCVHC